MKMLSKIRFLHKVILGILLFLFINSMIAQVRGVGRRFSLKSPVISFYGMVFNKQPLAIQRDKVENRFDAFMRLNKRSLLKKDVQEFYAGWAKRDQPILL